MTETIDTDASVITPNASVPDQSPEQALIAASSSFTNYDTGNENRFQVVSDWDPAGAPPEAIKALSAGLDAGERFQTLLGITGSGKSATIA